MPSAMPAIRADVSRARRILAATAGTITLQAASSATCEWGRGMDHDYATNLPQRPHSTGPEAVPHRCAREQITNKNDCVK